MQTLTDQALPAPSNTETPAPIRATGIAWGNLHRGSCAGCSESVPYGMLLCNGCLRACLSGEGGSVALRLSLFVTTSVVAGLLVAAAARFAALIVVGV